MKIRRLKGLKFKGKNNTVCEFSGGFGLYVDGKGFVSFKGVNEQNGVKTPYSNKKKVLQEIIVAGGLTSLENVEFINQMEVM